MTKDDENDSRLPATRAMAFLTNFLPMNIVLSNKPIGTSLGRRNTAPEKVERTCWARLNKAQSKRNIITRVREKKKMSTTLECILETMSMDVSLIQTKSRRRIDQNKAVPNVKFTGLDLLGNNAIMAETVTSLQQFLLLRNVEWFCHKPRGDGRRKV